MTRSYDAVLKNDIFHLDFREGLKQVKDSSINLLLTDPPYLLDVADWDNNFDFDHFFSLVSGKLKSGGAALVFCSSNTMGNCIEAMKVHDFTVRRVLAWEKTNPTPMRNSYTYALEHIIFAVKGQSTATFNLPAHILSHSGIFKYSSVEKERFHIAQKPLSLLVELIEIHSNVNDTILDCFSGSGAVSVAAQMTNRNSIAFEIDGDYFMKSYSRLGKV